jgi:hypothetical protein
VVLEGGTLTSSAAGSLPAPSTARLVRAWTGVVAGTVAVGTLLGPEGAGNRCLGSGPADLSYRPHRAGSGGGGAVGGWSYVENCTVDASIFLTL